MNASVGHYEGADASQCPDCGGDTALPCDVCRPMVCVHHWSLEPLPVRMPTGELFYPGKCKLCNQERVFTNAQYEKPGFHKPTERQRDAVNRDLKAREFAAVGLTYQGRYD